MYIKELDLLFKLPSFNYHSTTGKKLLGTIKGLVVLYTVLNTNVKKWYRMSGGDFKTLTKCGWTNALESSKAVYKSEIMVEKPGQVEERKSPSPPVNEQASDEIIQEMMSNSKSFKRRKVE